MAQEDILIPSSGIRDLGAKELDRSALPQTINQLSLTLNSKESGYYPLVESLSGRLWFPNYAQTSNVYPTQSWRPGLRKVISLGTLPDAAGTLSVFHGITVTATTFFIQIYGTANDLSTSFLPLPYSSATANDVIEVSVDATKVHVKVGKDRSGYTDNFIVLEYLAY